MAYALLKLLHLGSIVIWVGGMFFAIFCLRPAAMNLSPPTRVPFMADALGRFFNIVLWLALATLGSGVAMMMQAAKATRQTGAAFNMPLDWMVMAVLGLVMMAIFGHIRFALYKRLQRAVVALDWPAGGAALGAIRTWVAINLGIGTLILLVVLLGKVS